MNLWIKRAAVLMCVVACGCEIKDPGGENPVAKYATPTEQLLAEFPGEVPTVAVDQVLELSKMLTLQTRSQGIYDMVAALKKGLPGKDTASLNDVEDFNLGQPLAGVGEYVGPKTDEFLKADNPNKKFFECPPLEMEGYDSCAQIVDAVLKKVNEAVDVEALKKLAKDLIANDPVVSAQSQDFKDYATQYLDDLALDIHKFGIQIAAIRAEYALRKAGVCDHQVIDGKEIAKLRGIAEGEEIIRQIVGKQKLELAPQGGECLRIGAKGAGAEAIIKAATEKYLKEGPAFCPDTSAGNLQIVELTKWRMEGIKRGIDAHTTTIWVGIFRNGHKWQSNEYVVANIDGCDAKDQIQYTTSPLVLDLDGDGLTLTTNRVRFDLRATGQPQQVTWTGKGEGLLALDLDGNGRITSGRELFGDRSLCGTERCADGAAALAVYDSKAAGGNGDGRIDARDAVFGRLKVWVDASSDGKSQPDELRSLADHGVRSLSLKVTPMDQRVLGGRISLSLSVDTDRGPRDAFDVWFDNLASPGFHRTTH